MQKFKELVSVVDNSREDMMKFVNSGNKAAGTRVRVAMQKAKVLAQEIRKEISEAKSK